ncbi:hypothetical protein J7F03_21615 [Streptomyces sp. ISL-43]|uniref:HAAS signaling domain-containing protein n=1 Tax=Streptomyces sp. ISL-43 TaxID=2819183 RepID=UPI001BE783C7|nr:hypothetical protein [Streptomyces sp. ISL-43]MBT2449632.1 hypothetical protein [Streptomyces sp. ISL-43]
MNGTEHPLVTAYLAAFTEEADVLPASRRDELIADLREHLDLAVKDTTDEKTVRAALEQLGSPDVIVAAALAEEDAGAPHGAAPRATDRPQTRSRTVITAVLIGVTGLAGLSGSLVGGIALLCGLILLWTSAQWQRGTKLLVTALALATPGVLALGAATGVLSKGTTPMQLLVLMTAGIVLPAVAAVRLLRAPEGRAR